ncbi:MAG: hypothetical protein CM15mV22_1070 [Eurybiavirus sp.]|nr:MAG: hypothetical protein CM15mV22_1070 [Eurybiavirus sp.]
MKDEFLWVEKYRPKNIEHCILPKDIKDTFQSFVKKGEVPNLLYVALQVLVKLRIAKALCKELGVDFI